jgi:hypothetical protein
MSSLHSVPTDADGVIQEWLMALEYVARAMGQGSDESDQVPPARRTGSPAMEIDA